MSLEISGAEQSRQRGQPVSSPGQERAGCANFRQEASVRRQGENAKESSGETGGNEVRPAGLQRLHGAWFLLGEMGSSKGFHAGGYSLSRVAGACCCGSWD